MLSSQLYSIQQQILFDFNESKIRSTSLFHVLLSYFLLDHVTKKLVWILTKEHKEKMSGGENPRNTLPQLLLDPSQEPSDHQRPISTSPEEQRAQRQVRMQMKDWEEWAVSSWSSQGSWSLQEWVYWSDCLQGMGVTPESSLRVCITVCARKSSSWVWGIFSVLSRWV